MFNNLIYVFCNIITRNYDAVKRYTSFSQIAAWNTPSCKTAEGKVGPARNPADTSRQVLVLL